MHLAVIEYGDLQPFLPDITPSRKNPQKQWRNKADVVVSELPNIYTEEYAVKGFARLMLLKYVV